MTTYFIDYYKDLCNTYTVYAVAPEDRERFIRLFPDAERITRDRAINRGWSRVREARQDGEYWPAGFAERLDTKSASDFGPQTVATVLEDCRVATRQILDDREVRIEAAQMAKEAMAQER